MDGPKKQTWLRRHWNNLKQWIITHKAASIIGAIIIVLAFTGLALWAFVFTPKLTGKLINPFSSDVPATPKVFYSPLTGEKVKDAGLTKRQVTGIMIENSPDARPQSGMLGAGIIYEAIAEGGITRFQCVYQEGRPQLIGPVRSLRPYYLEWLAPYDAAFAHIGGSYKALQEVRNGKYKDIDQFFNAGAYWRATDRYAPHNVYTSFDKLDALNKSKGFTSSKFTAFKRKVAAPAPKPNAKQISVQISGGAYNSNYTYDAKANNYKRFQGGEPHTDRESKKQLSPSVVIVMKVAMTLGFEDGYREQIKTTGSGEAIIFQDGKASKATWSKKATKSPLIFKDAKGKEIAFNKGQTWITALPNGRGVSWN